MVSINELPVVNLGNDTIICRENDYILNSNAPSAVQFEWNDLSALSSIQTSGQGEYSVKVTDANGCMNYDTIQIDTFPSPIPVINIQDTAICLGDSVTLEVNPIYNFYAWTNSNSFINTTVVRSTNEYILRVLDANGCLGSDTANVLINPLPNAALGDSVKLCRYKELILKVPEDSADYIWSTGSVYQNESITVAGEYWVTVRDSNACVSSDTVIVYDGEMLNIDLGFDTTICSGSSLTLDASYIHTEIWESTDTLSEFNVQNKDTIDVLVINDDGCYGRDTIIINFSDIPEVDIIQGDSLGLCELAFQEHQISIIDNEGMEILWSTYETKDSIIVNVVNPYIVQKTNEYGCSGFDTILVYEFCKPVNLTMPNVFTPNGDGFNDKFVPIESESETLEFFATHILEIDFTVYNRWGRIIFHSTGMLPNWDGTNIHDGKVSSNGTYFWVLNYLDVSGITNSKNGFVELIR